MADKSGNKGFVKNGVQFNFETEELYCYEAFKYGNVSADELRKEYSRQRRTAIKRLERMKGTVYEDSQTFRKNYGKYTTLAQIEKEALESATRRNLPPAAAQKYVDITIAHKMADLYKFLTAKSGSIRGLQRIENETIKTLSERGFTFVNKNNIRQFGTYMEQMRTMKLNSIYGSDRVAEMFGVAEKKGINPEEILKDFEFWLQHKEEISKMKKIENPQHRTAEEYKKLLNR